MLAEPQLQGRLLSHQLFSPNLQPHIVSDLRAHGLVHTEQCCALVFLQRYADVIRDKYGGLALAFLDVWGGYATGARPLIEISLRLRLLEPRGCMMTFAASDRADRALGHTTVAVRMAVERDAQQLFRDAGLLERALEPPADLPAVYHTMQVYGWYVDGCGSAGRPQNPPAVPPNPSNHPLGASDADLLVLQETQTAVQIEQGPVSKLVALQAERGARLTTMAETLARDPDIDWNTIKQRERERAGPQWVEIHWKRRLVKRLVTPGRFTHGGARQTCHRVSPIAAVTWMGTSDHGASRIAPCYQLLQNRVQQNEAAGAFNLERMANRLSEDDTINWDEIILHESHRADWMQTNWKCRLVKVLSNPEIWTPSGVRRTIQETIGNIEE